jgi:hypothetical protein
MTNNHCRFFCQYVQQINQIADETQQAVLINAFWAIGLAVAAHMGSYHVETGSSPESELVTPGVLKTWL